jgi:hypothetical protein
LWDGTFDDYRAIDRNVLPKKLLVRQVGGSTPFDWQNLSLCADRSVLNSLSHCHFLPAAFSCKNASSASELWTPEYLKSRNAQLLSGNQLA